MLNLLARWKWVVRSQQLYSRERALLSIVEEVVWTAGLARTSMARKLVFKPWIIQPVSRCYTVYTNSQITDKHNIKESLHIVGCCESSITYSECVFVVLVIWHVYCHLWPVWVYHIHVS
jgi:hypothetical protein